MSSKKIIIGARGSKLSLVQVDIIKQQLQRVLPHSEIVIKIIKTTGDRNMSPVPLDSVGKGWFTKELDKALFEGKIDIAVHSLKDIPETLSKELIIAAIPEREDAREALISKNNIPFIKLKKGAVIGTDSLRRKTQILHQRPDIIVKSIRGNVNTRVAKFDKGEYDGIFLAVAGLKRLGLEDRITQYFKPADIIPAPGQGALAVVARGNDEKLLTILTKLNHKETIAAVKAERAFSRAFGTGCKLPVGGYAHITKEKIILYGMVGSEDGTHIAKDSISGNSTAPVTIGKKLAKLLLRKSPWYSDEKYIVITRPEKENNVFKTQIEQFGYSVFSYPTITITKVKITPKMREKLHQIDTCDWVVFTSKNGVKFFIEALLDAHISVSTLLQKQIAVIGPKTAEEVGKYRLPVHFIPSQFTTKDLAKELPVVAGKKILMPRANIATPQLTKHLREKGAKVIDLPIYKTLLLQRKNKNFETLIKKELIKGIIFTSPSTVEGFLENIKHIKNNDFLFSLPVIAIGPVTVKKLKIHGFRKINMAKRFTTDGIIAKLKENIL
jgi:hydroxymethylbilane synthase